jgi:hypothetical protein
MRKSGLATVLIVTVFGIVAVVQWRTGNRLRHELDVVTEENSRLRQDLAAQESSRAGTKAEQTPGGPEQKKVEELELEVLRLRGMANRAMRAEAEVAQLKSESRQVYAAAASDASVNSTSNTLLTFLGEAVPPPPNLDPAYSKEGLLSAIQQAAQLAGVTLKKVEIETSEFPFLAGVVCNQADFEKVRAQFKNMPGYEYGGSSSSRGTYAFNITPYRSYPSDAAERIGRRMTLRMQMLRRQLAGP